MILCLIGVALVSLVVSTVTVIVLLRVSGAVIAGGRRGQRGARLGREGRVGGGGGDGGGGEWVA